MALTLKNGKLNLFINGKKTSPTDVPMSGKQLFLMKVCCFSITCQQVQQVQLVVELVEQLHVVYIRIV